MTHEHYLDCPEILSRLNDYIDGDLNQDLCHEIEAHLEGCSKCKIVLNTLQKTIHIVQVDGQETHIPSDVRQRLLEQLDLDQDDH